MHWREKKCEVGKRREERATALYSRYPQRSFCKNKKKVGADDVRCELDEKSSGGTGLCRVDVS